MQTTSRGKPRRRISLSSHKTEIERWVDEGKTDDWIAHALGTSRSSVQSFRSRSRIYRRNRSASDETEAAAESSLKTEHSVYEGVLEHGEQDGYGLWLDPSVADDPIFQKGFAEVSDVNVRVEESRIVLQPAPATRPAAAPPAKNGSPDSNATATEVSSELETVFEGGAVNKASAALPASNEEQGEVKWFEADKGYGFIHRPDGSEIFFHKSEIKGADTLAEKSEVRYEVGSNQRGLVAKDVRVAP